jgi:hypothetical protein
MRDPQETERPLNVVGEGDGETILPSDPSVGDRDLIRWTLSLSPEERLAVLQDFVDTFWTPQHG